MSNSISTAQAVSIADSGLARKYRPNIEARCDCKDVADVEDKKRRAKRIQYFGVKLLLDPEGKMVGVSCKCRHYYDDHQQ